MAFTKQDVWSQYTAMLPELIKEHNLKEILAAISDQLDEECIMSGETSCRFKDYALAQRIVEAAAVNLDLNFGWRNPSAKCEDIRRISIENFKQMANDIQGEAK